MFVFPTETTLIFILSTLFLEGFQIRIQMKRFLLLFAFFIPLVSSAQDYGVLNGAFAEGNASAIGKWLAPTVDFSLDGKEQNIGRGDCETQLQAYFIKHSPRSFKQVHEGVSGSDVHYMIGELSTGSGVYRVTLYLNKSGEDYRIHSLEIEK
ncbi:MAG: hypothetical protein Salg2KO_13090 [Salibacteraceae bacterium]